MRRSTLSISCSVALLFIGPTVALALADNSRRANATVSFGQ